MFYNVSGLCAARLIKKNEQFKAEAGLRKTLVISIPRKNENSIFKKRTTGIFKRTNRR